MPSDPLDAPKGVPTDRLDELYAAALDEFANRRDALAKELRKDHREAADWVKALKKPSAAAWAVNQLGRIHPEAASDLLAAGEALAAAHERLMSGKGGAAELREASQREAEAIRALMGLSRELPGRAPSDATMDRVAETLQAVALDAATREAFADGRLTKEQRASGIGPFTLGEASAVTTPPKSKTSADKPRKADDAKPRKDEGREAAAELQRLRDEEREAAAEARRRRTEERERAKQELQDAKDERRVRRKEVKHAQRALQDAKQTASVAQKRLAQAEAALAKAEETAGHADQRVAELQSG